MLGEEFFTGPCTRQTPKRGNRIRIKRDPWQEYQSASSLTPSQRPLHRICNANMSTEPVQTRISLSGSFFREQSRLISYMTALRAGDRIRSTFELALGTNSFTTPRYEIMEGRSIILKNGLTS